MPFNKSGQLFVLHVEWSATRVSGITAEDARAEKDYAQKLPGMARPLKPVTASIVRWRPRSEHVPCVSTALWKATIGFLEHTGWLTIAGSC